MRAFHGVYPEEKRDGNDFVVDVRLETDISRAGETDALAQTVDYSQAYALVLEIMADPVDLLETLVLKMGQELLARFLMVSAVRVRVSKVQPMGMPQCRHTFVEERLQRATP